MKKGKKRLKIRLQIAYLRACGRVNKIENRIENTLQGGINWLKKSLESSRG